MKTEKKSSIGKVIRVVLIALAALLLLGIGGGAVLFGEELKITGSIEKVEGFPCYYMEVEGDYHFDELLASGGVSSDEEISVFLTKVISHGFYSVDTQSDGLACSTISAATPDGGHSWGRNFDWDGSVPILVRCTPDEGYASIATCDFKNITGSSETVPEDFPTKMLAISALYVPMDGINSAGLCVADLEVNEGGMPDVCTDKPDLTITAAIRLLLNKAANVDEAVELLQQYDVHASGSISHHLAVSDSEGRSVSIEFTESGIKVMESASVTNFNLANGDTAAGGESAMERYDTLCTLYDQCLGVLSREQVKQALASVAKSEGEWTTQWSLVYDDVSKTVDYYFGADFSKPLSYSIG